MHPKNFQELQGDKMTKKKKELTTLEKSTPKQLELFYLPRNEPYSRSIDFNDSVPKYFRGRPTRVDGVYLPALERVFRHRKEDFKVIITPAKLVDKKGNQKDYYPGTKEELIEDALRKLATVKGKGFFLDDGEDKAAGVVFSLYELQKELARMGHKYNLNEIKDGLYVCSKASLEIETKDGRGVIITRIFDTLGLVSREDWEKKGKSAKAYVRFNPLVTQSINNLTFRSLNYEKSMSIKNTLARWLFKRISHNFIQASHINKYTIHLSTILRDSGFTVYASIANNNRFTRKALNELVENETLANYDEQRIFVDGSSRSYNDVKYILHPHLSFIKEMKLFNKKFAEQRGDEALPTSFRGDDIDGD